MTAPLERSLTLIFGHEGAFTLDRNDRGNWTTGKIGSGVLKGTKYGISAMSYPALDIKNLTLAQAAAIYRRDYAAAVRFDDLPPGVDHAALDFAINSGAARAIIGLQRVLGLADDGRLGPLTLAAVNTAGPQTLIRALCAERLAFLKQLSTWPLYKNGWTTRVNRVEQEALGMVAAVPPSPPDLAPAPAAPSVSWWAALLTALAKVLKS